MALRGRLPGKVVFDCKMSKGRGRLSWTDAIMRAEIARRWHNCILLYCRGTVSRPIKSSTRVGDYVFLQARD